MAQSALGDRIKSAREAKDWSLEDLASAMTGSGERDASTLGQIERGEIERPPDDVLESIASALDIGADELKRLRPSLDARSPWRIRADGTPILNIGADIGEDFGGGVTAESVRAFLADHPDAKDVHIEVNSMGGDPFEAQAINAVLNRHRVKTGGRLTGEITGMAASAAVTITSNMDHVAISDGSQMMIHFASSFTFGNVDRHERAIAVLTVTDDFMARLHARKTGRKVGEVRQAMAEERTFDADAAVDFGLADEVTQRIDIAATMKRWTDNPKYRDYLATRRTVSAQKEKMDLTKLAALLGMPATASAHELETRLGVILASASTVADVADVRAQNLKLQAENAILKEATNKADCESRIVAMIAEGRLVSPEDKRVDVYRNMWTVSGQEVADQMADTWEIPKAIGETQHKPGDKAGHQATGSLISAAAAFAKLDATTQSIALAQQGKFTREDCITHYFTQFPHIAARMRVDMTTGAN